MHSPSCNGVSLGVVQFRHPLAPGTLLFHGLRQHQTFIGGLLDMPLGIRVIASTHIDLDAVVEVGDSAQRPLDERHGADSQAESRAGAASGTGTRCTNSETVCARLGWFSYQRLAVSHDQSGVSAVSSL